ncbi:serine/threonine-protein kinase [Oryzihumus leptocrescens]|uniref:non-specific serine/threonine protein kinase n=1 Tax=Oryzihumus leptocrescens TaxID=297536 RepID=A0A542ZKZ4_9MICO|nr:serine/threonine-protein kinase [Oryzihumus leptocrescens]TQL61016.1 serine/threonine protein kinase [Oryzihumus leptocrescens]
MDSGPTTRPSPVPVTVGAGDVLADRYRLEHLLGRGGMAEVFAGRDEVLQRPVAVKVFPWVDDDLSSQEPAEIRLLAALSHPALVTVHDAGPPAGDGSPTFLVMELVPGPTLSRQLREQGPLSEVQAAALACQVASALAYVHARDLVHRDVKPGNILLREAVTGPEHEIVAKLADFGIARLVNATRRTLTGTALGTAPYLSPEQVRGEPIGPATDVYALALVVLESLTGTVTYPGSAIESAVARLHRPPDVPEGLDPVLHRLLLRMTDTEPSRRPSAGEVAETLATLLGGDVTATQPLRASRRAADRAASRRARARDGLASSWRRLQAVPPAGRRAALAVAVAGSLLAAGFLILGSGGSSATPAVRPPAYPSVPGRLGVDLHDLQQAVQG